MEPVTENVGHLVRKKILVRLSDNNFTCQDRRTDDIWERLQSLSLFNCKNSVSDISGGWKVTCVEGWDIKLSLSEVFIELLLCMVLNVELLLVVCCPGIIVLWL